MNSSLVLKNIIYNQAQIRHYGKVRLPPQMLVAVKRAQNPSKIPIPQNDDISKENDTNYDVKEAEREKWGTYGNKSGISLHQILPTHQEIAEEYKAEKEWWPTLQQIKSEANEANKFYQNQTDERNRKIKENMAKMPEWITKYKDNLKKEQDEIEANLMKKERKLEEVQELFGYKIDKKHPRFAQYLESKKEDEKLEKKKIKKEKKKEAQHKKQQAPSALY